MKVQVMAVAALALLVWIGCATKRHVRETVDPVKGQVADLDKKTISNASAIQDLEEKTTRGISRVDEKIAATDAKAAEAGKMAGQANTQAVQAGDKAEAARTLAEGGVARTGRLEKVVESLDQFRAGPSFTVYFDFNQSELSAEGQQELAKLAQALPKEGRYAIEVQGFTDTTGASDYNYALSERR
ncbi:MAG: OmpA family protein, partial [Gemmatimonadales bacterium]